MPRKGKKRLRGERRAEGVPESQEKQAGARAEETDEEKEERLKLAQHVDKMLKRVKGETICKGEVKQVLRLYFHLVMKKKKDPNGAAQYVSDAFGVDKSVIESARDEFTVDRTIRARVWNHDSDP